MERAGFTLWLTGMRGSGKSTLASYVGQRLRNVGRPVEILDGEELEKSSLFHGLESPKEARVGEELSPAGRRAELRAEAVKDVRRLGYVAKLLTRNNVIAISATVSPHREPRDSTRREIGRFVEVFVDCPVERLIERDTKGLYKKALAGELPHFTGITEPYEPPSHPEVVVRTNVEKVEESAQKIFQALLDLGYLKPAEVSAILGQKARRRPLPPKRASRPVRARRSEPKPKAKGGPSLRRTKARPMTKHAAGRKADRPSKSTGRRARR